MSERRNNKENAVDEFVESAVAYAIRRYVAADTITDDDEDDDRVRAFAINVMETVLNTFGHGGLEDIRECREDGTDDDLNSLFVWIGGVRYRVKITAQVDVPSCLPAHVTVQ